jgi:vancomycin resistance protein YoaR
MSSAEIITETPRRSRGFIIGLATTLACLGVAGAGATYSYSRSLPDPTKIAPGVSVGGVPVGGLSREEALEKTRTWAREQLSKAVVLTAPSSEKKWAITTGELGGRFELDAALDAAWQVGKDDNFFERLYHGNKERNVSLTPDFKLDTAKLDTHLAKIAKAVHKPARSARAKMDAKGGLVLAEPEQKGIELDTAATKAAVLKNGVAALADGETVELTVKEEQPKVTASDLGKMGTLLAAFTTDYGGSPRNRKANVALAASKINGTLMAPGEVFSYNACVGPREAELGWKMAHQYQDGLVVDGIGGGVCQVSTTLYNAVLLADLKIVLRENHSMPVAYVRPGRDATVSYDSVDFKFENSTDGPIFLGAKADGETLTFRLYGTKPPERKVLSLYTGERRYNASGGSSVTSYRKVQLPDGTTKTEVIDSSYYRAPRSKN